MAPRSSKQGGSLARTETVTIRLDPKLNYLCELAARSQRRTKSSLIEAALALALNQVPVDPRPREEPTPSIAALAEVLWDVDEVTRFQLLAFHAPHLMTYEEQTIWSTLMKTAHYWIGEWRVLDPFNLRYEYACNPQSLWIDRIREDWTLIKNVASKRTNEDRLPKMEVVMPRNPEIEGLLGNWQRQGAQS